MRRPTEQDVCPRCKRRGGLHLVSVVQRRRGTRQREQTVYCDACGWEVTSTDLPPIRRTYGAEKRPKAKGCPQCYTTSNQSPE